MDSRKQFEARFYPNGTDIQPMAMVNALFEIWQAGRESMRDEALAEAEQGIWIDKTGSEIADCIAKAINDIKP